MTPPMVFIVCLSVCYYCSQIFWAKRSMLKKWKKTQKIKRKEKLIDNQTVDQSVNKQLRTMNTYTNWVFMYSLQFASFASLDLGCVRHSDCAIYFPWHHVYSWTNIRWICRRYDGVYQTWLRKTAYYSGILYKHILQDCMCANREASEAILMSAHSIHLQVKRRKSP